MRSASRRLAVFALLLFGGAALHADEVRLRGGSVLTGVVLRQDDAGLVLLLPRGEELRLAAADVAAVARDPESPGGDRMLRLVESAAGTRLQTPVVHLVGPKGRPRVDLVGAVHIADRAYFRGIQALLEEAQVVLYEVVKPKDVPVADLPSNPLRELQGKLGRALGLVFQMDEIDYDRPHFVHADLAPEELVAAPEGAATAPREGAGAPAGSGLPPEIERLLPMVQVVSGLLDGFEHASPEQKANLARMVARMMAALGPRVSTLIGPRLSDLLIARRNAIVVERLRAVPDGTRDVAVFYGAGHLPDLEKRITETLGYRRAGGRWVDAWRIPPPRAREAASGSPDGVGKDAGRPAEPPKAKQPAVPGGAR